MFAMKVLVDIRKEYYDPDSDDPRLSEESFKQRCKAFAQEVGLPPSAWAQITLPCFISLDNDKRHTWMRQVLSVPRHRHLEDFDRRLLSEELNISLDDMPAELSGPPAAREYEVPRYDPASTVSQSTRDVIDGLHRRREWEHRQIILHEHLATKRRMYYVLHNVDALDYARWKYALLHPELGICMTPLHLMPLAANTPDIHAPPEHAVGTVKRTVTAAFSAATFDKKLLSYGRTYQQKILEAVSSKLNGEAGLHHISGSVRKQPYTCKILAADKDQVVEVPVRGPDGQVTVKEVYGTAGAWISERNMS